ncbi:MAG: hypothetical protein HOW73_32180 [Polyangiaceae bacterium]|nr:hypothetical protein [Polyangiaceae bacterium]
MLGPIAASHPSAATTLLKGLALWHDQRLAGALCADDEFDGAALGLWDGGTRRSITSGPRLPRAPKCPDGAFTDVGDFRDLRQVSLFATC